MSTLLTHFYPSIRSLFIGALTALVITGCGGSGVGGRSSSGPTPTPAPDPTTAVAKIVLSSSSPSVKSDDSNQADVTATLLTAGNAIVVGASADFTSSSGVMVVANPISDAKGQITGKFSSGSADAATRTATVTVISNNISQQIPVRVTGSTIDLTLVGTTTLPNDGSKTADLEITLKNAGGSPVGNTAVTVSSLQLTGGALSFSTDGGKTFSASATGTADASGKLIAQVKGSTAGTVNASVSGLGETRTQTFTVTQVTSSNNFTVSAVNGVALPADRIIPLSTGSSIEVTVTAPSPTANVVFASSLGAWDGGTSNVITKAAVAGVAKAILVATNTGVANVQVYDPAKPSLTESFTAAITAPSTDAANITLQASPNVVAKAVAGVAGTSSIVATVTDRNGQPVGGAAVSFKMVKAPGGGESINPVVQLTASVPGADVGLGQARITFTSGSLPSAQGGVQIRAQVVGTTVATKDPTLGAPSDALITIGGTAGSIAFGTATVLTEAGNATAYVLAMSVLVADSNGNAVPNAKVNLSSWPYAWSTGAGCATTGTYLNEDTNENLILDAGEDGVRFKISDDQLAPLGFVGGGRLDGRITAVNSAAGALPSVVTTDASGLASFNYTYTKQSALWVVTRIRASTIVQGTETVAETKFRLSGLEKDITPICRLDNSPYLF